MDLPDASVPRGSGVLRHPAREHGWMPAAESESGNAEAIEAHVERYFGKPTYVWHEIASDLVHLDAPRARDRAVPRAPAVHALHHGHRATCRWLITRDGAGASPYAELVICLPPTGP